MTNQKTDPEPVAECEVMPNGEIDCTDTEGMTEAEVNSLAEKALAAQTTGDSGA